MVWGITNVSRMLAVVALSISSLLVACSKIDVPDEPIIEGIAFVSMSVSDVERTASMLSEAAGMDAHSLDAASALAWSRMMGSENAPSVLLRGFNAQLLAQQHPEPPASPSAVPVNGPGIAHLCFQVNQTTETYEAFLSQGAEAIGNPDLVQINPKRPVYYGYLHDHDGILYEVEHVDVEALDLPEPPPNDYRIRHISLATPDMEAAVEFYAVLFSEPEPRWVGRLLSLRGENLDAVSGLPDSKIQMAWFQSRNLELELIQYESHATERPESPRPFDALGYNLIVFDVSDLEAARARVSQAGGQVLNELTDVPGGLGFLARDPDGNLLGFQKVAAVSELSSAQFSGNGT